MERISDETVWRVLKNEIKPWQNKPWCISQVMAEFVWRMEDVLDLNAQLYEVRRVVVCFDEQPCQLLMDVREPLPIKLYSTLL